MTSHFSFDQDFYRLFEWTVDVDVCHENDASVGASLDTFIDSIENNAVGLFGVYGVKGALTKLALATYSRVLIISVKPGTKVKSALVTRRRLETDILAASTITKEGFLLDSLSYSLFHDLGVRIKHAFNLTKSFGSPSLQNFIDVLGDRDIDNKEAARSLFKTLEKREVTNAETARHAWLTVASGLLPDIQKKRPKRIAIDTVVMDVHHLKVVSKLHRHQALLRNLVPDVVQNEVSGDAKFKGGNISVVSARFKTRIQYTGGQQTLQLCMKQGDRVVNIAAKTKKVDGRSVSITSSSKTKLPAAGALVSVKTIGREPPSNSEAIRTNLFGQILQGRSSILTNPFVRTIWLPHEKPNWVPVKAMSSMCSGLVPSSTYNLNVSQVTAVNAILSPAQHDRVVLVHGPPGTGKTTVIGAATYNLTSRDPQACIWLVAHSNVAVKNIAEKLVQIGFEDFRLVVSKDFHYDWHEHLYQKVEHRMIRTDSLPKTAIEASRMVLGSRVILCTLTTLLNDKLSNIARVVPVEALVVDEASQIEVGDYIPIINRYQSTLRKLVFIGDHKQLAPYGSEDVKELESIFEKDHLCKRAIMLDTQYRMPIPIGAFISQHVYGGKLKSQHPLSSFKTCRFVDVKGSSEMKRGHSWVNIKEVQAVIALARTLDASKMSFKIITPYDPQRSMIENQLKQEKLPHEDKCFNVDSFQGNEADYIIISLVRSDKLGFLQESRRVNVMLTRCKRGMVICTSRHFVQSIAKGSLVGKLAATVGEKAWMESKRVLYSNANPFN
ncbi:hypothetical protein CC1G_06290 [Coprinopsis cinerea okayama7|uniref:DNA2/NAM7 helicase-like C-terminal domain-containing protein n=1 Tax=Coprinopsis cinerea (strain Okayama-7 / 130 / ATCC MYA-4618 / FGSC 9003) TaxID=240176 RepID=A8NTD9_COPC7|nr:hypothetical protein CC1G_06290 [Coprinopsis cinerea okayama7\|eukprot:XP_001836205.1 hypothetical protein CC1G_06290 [Coprinopsis cinerea okayama7\